MQEFRLDHTVTGLSKRLQHRIVIVVSDGGGNGSIGFNEAESYMMTLFLTMLVSHSSLSPIVTRYLV